MSALRHERSARQDVLDILCNPSARARCEPRYDRYPVVHPGAGLMNTKSERSTMSLLLESPVLTRTRVRTAYAIAVATDALQLVLGPVGWALVDEALDVVAAVAMWRILGFHPLLLPTFIVEFLPVTDLLPTWTGCVAVVVALRKRQQQTSTPPPASGTVIDV